MSLKCWSLSQTVTQINLYLYLRLQCFHINPGVDIKIPQNHTQWWTATGALVTWRWLHFFLCSEFHFMFDPLWSLWSNKIIIARWWNRRSSERCARRSTRQSRRSLMVRAIRREPFSFIHYILNIFSFQWFDWSFRADRLEPSAKLEFGFKDVSLKVEEEKIKWTLGDRSELFDQERLCSRGASLLKLPCASKRGKASLPKNIRKQHFLPTTTCLWDWLALTHRRGVAIQTYLV